jgi:hypothetical protein
MMARTRCEFLCGLTIACGAVVGRSGVGTAKTQETQIGASRMDQYDPANTGYASNETGPQTNLQELWQYDAEAALFGSPALYRSPLPSHGTNDTGLFGVRLCEPRISKNHH